MPQDNESTIITDDTVLLSVDIDSAFFVVRCVCFIASRKSHLTWEPKNARWFPKAKQKTIKLIVSVDLLRSGGNLPTKSKDTLPINWATPVTQRDAIASIGFAILYFRPCPWFEDTIKPVRTAIKGHTLVPHFVENLFPKSSHRSCS